MDTRLLVARSRSVHVEMTELDPNVLGEREDHILPAQGLDDVVHVFLCRLHRDGAGVDGEVHFVQVDLVVARAVDVGERLTYASGELVPLLVVLGVGGDVGVEASGHRLPVTWLRGRRGLEGDGRRLLSAEGEDGVIGRLQDRVDCGLEGGSNLVGRDDLREVVHPRAIAADVHAGDAVGLRHDQSADGLDRRVVIVVAELAIRLDARNGRVELQDGGNFLHGGSPFRQLIGRYAHNRLIRLL